MEKITVFHLIVNRCTFKMYVIYHICYVLQENRVAELEADYEQNQSDLKLAFKRIADLQSALEEGLDSDDDFSDR